MIDGINDTDVDADALAALLRGEHAHVNLIPMNAVAHTPWTGTPIPAVERFAARLQAAGIATTIRFNRGTEIGAACGQLAAEHAGQPTPIVVQRRREQPRRRERGGPPRRAQRASPRPAGVGEGVSVSDRRPRGVLIAASILDCDLGALGDEIRRAEAAGADRIHLDVMDGHFVPNITFGWKTIEAVRRVTALPFDAHLMISEPGRWTDQFLDAGCDSITFHVEVGDAQIRPALERIREAGRSAGLSVKPRTPLAALDAYRDLLDIVLVMTVEPGFGGQSFMDDVAAGEARRRRARCLDPAGALEIHVDGGGRRETAEVIGRGGTDVIVVGSALYRAADMAAEVVRIRALANAARAATLPA